MKSAAKPNDSVHLHLTTFSYTNNNLVELLRNIIRVCHSLLFGYYALIAEPVDQCPCEWIQTFTFRYCAEKGYRPRSWITNPADEISQAWLDADIESTFHAITASLGNVFDCSFYIVGENKLRCGDGKLDVSSLSLGG